MYVAVRSYNIEDIWSVWQKVRQAVRDLNIATLDGEWSVHTVIDCDERGNFLLRFAYHPAGRLEDAKYLPNMRAVQLESAIDPDNNLLRPNVVGELSNCAKALPIDAT